MSQPEPQDRNAAPAAIILAAGKGTRMRSDLPKVMHEVGGAPMVRHVVEACLEAGCGRVVVVVGHRQELVRAALRGYAPRVVFAEQREQLGTGHAVQCAMPALRDGPGRPRHADVFVLCGDGPLIRAETLEKLLRRHRRAGAAATLATAVIEDPSGYGRIARDEQGRFVGIVEQRDCTPEQLAVGEVNPSYYCFDVNALAGVLPRLERNEVKGEYYITDAPRLLMDDGAKVEVIEAVPPEDVLSINTPEELARVDRIFRERRGAACGGQR